ncbi:ammonium transport protein (Amt family) [Bradyrhizobium sp. ORS 375]|uniref:ammonium transporter n=1 Tax=Bradyrhizobium sp. (strain ORS 375) TaxID=566679 RepID=UPI000240914E|nr:ammonium transporter [Bradyrhizobium sp. ORS 375]CCD96994.1 ammonium transport protein (Amt family) [Bradyrhizobium sp. ORS 375]
MGTCASRCPRASAALAAAGAVIFTTPASAAAPSTIDAADTAWMIVATALVLMMTIPGLALFYSGMVRKKNVLATMAQSLAAVMLISILWVAFGYSLAFVGDGPWIGTLDRAFLAGMGMDSVHPGAKTIPEALFMLYQMTFAIITVALVAGSVADRMRFSAYLVFGVAWFIFVYLPLAHWIWGGGFLSQAGVVDFAGGLVVHLSAGTGGLVAALVMGRRHGYGSENLSPFDLSLAVVGTGLLWVGWFGFNGGSALSANAHAVMAILTTHLAACAGAVTWGALEWSTRRKPSVLGMISGAVAGLGTITPASGYVAPWHGLVIGALAGIICYWACTSLKHRFNYDDSLDVFGVHGIGGLTGTLMAGVFATAAIGGTAGLIEGNPKQLLSQLYGVAVTLVWSGGVTWGLLKLVSAFVPLRVSREQELEGLDISQHGEALQ